MAGMAGNGAQGVDGDEVEKSPLLFSSAPANPLHPAECNERPTSDDNTLTQHDKLHKEQDGAGKGQSEQHTATLATSVVRP